MKREEVISGFSEELPRKEQSSKTLEKNRFFTLFVRVFQENWVNTCLYILWIFLYMYLACFAYHFAGGIHLLKSENKLNYSISVNFNDATISQALWKPCAHSEICKLFSFSSFCHECLQKGQSIKSLLIRGIKSSAWLILNTSHLQD